MKNAKFLLSIFKVRVRHICSGMDLIGNVDEMPLSPPPLRSWDDGGEVNSSIAYTKPIHSPHLEESNSIAMLLSPTSPTSKIFLDIAYLSSVDMAGNDQSIRRATPNSLATHIATNMEDIVMSEEFDQPHHQAATPVSSQEPPASPSESDVLTINDNDHSAHQTDEPWTELTEFLLFPQLPIAVRRKIIDLNLPGPRLVELITVGLTEGEAIRDQFFGYTIEPVVNLYVSREWRNRTLKQYPLSFSVGGEEPLIPFNFNTDALYIGVDVSSDNAIKFKRHCRPWELASIKHLVVNSQINWRARWWDRDEQRYDRGWRLGGMSHKIFGGLKKYTSVFTDMKDPLPEWALRKWFPDLPDFASHRASNVDADRAATLMMANWPKILSRGFYLTEGEREGNRFGGISWEEKREYQIKAWYIPEVSVLGLREDVIDAFNNSEESSWAQILMDRAIEDIFD